MKLIPLTKGLFAKVDDSDYEYLLKFNWYAYYSKNTNSYYARRHIKVEKGKYSKVPMHREILQLNDPKIKVDHLNHDTLDNSRMNIRECSNRENQGNRNKNINNSSGYKGVSWHSVACKWAAFIAINGINTNIGLYVTKEDAARAYNVKSKEVFGDFALLNEVDGWENFKLSKKEKSSKYKGVSWSKNAKKWMAYVKINGKVKNLGYFLTEEEANIAVHKFIRL